MGTQTPWDFKRLANESTIAVLVQQSTTVIDRMAYALTPQQSFRALNDAQRTIASVLQGSTSYQISQVQTQKEDNTYTLTMIKERTGKKSI
jgi:hypothetical protein